MSKWLINEKINVGRCNAGRHRRRMRLDENCFEQEQCQAKSISRQRKMEN